MNEKNHRYHRTPLRLFAAVSTHPGARNSKSKAKWLVDGKEVGESNERWIDAPKAGKHKCRLTARDDGGEAEMSVALVTAAEHWPCTAD